MSQVMKKGIHGSRLGASSPGNPHPGPAPPAAAGGAPQPRAPDRRALRLGLVHHADDLDVLVAERHDPVGRPEPDVAPADDRVEAELLAETHRGPLNGAA